MDLAAETGIPLRVRPDLAFAPQWVGPQRVWAVKDPVAAKYYHLREEEFAILQALDGRTPPAEIRRQFAARFAPQELSPRGLASFLGRMHRAGLLLAEADGQGEQLLLRKQKRQLWERATTFSRILAMRFRGVDPQRFLDWLAPRTRWLFTPACAAFCLLLVAAALALVAVEFDTLLVRLPDFHALVAGPNAFLLLLSVAAVKGLHELGHALACRQFGSRCHEMGLMLLIFMPCLYCNVSDAWMIPDKWRRIAIGGAGMAVEIVLAAACTLLWWNSEPGWFNMLCFNVMLVSSINTLLLNGNPLLRYDGYYVLSDWLETPNLAERSRAVVSSTLARWCLGIELRPERELPERHRGWLAVYALAALVYRTIVVFAILWMLYETLAAHRLQVLAQAIVACVLAGMAMTPALRVYRFARDPGWQRRIDRRRLLPAVAVGLALLAGVLLVPVPLRVPAALILQAEGAYHQYVSAPGRLIESVAAGAHVERGATLARLDNPELRREVAKLTGEVAQRRAMVDGLQARRAQESLPAAQQALADLEQRLAQRRAEARELELVAGAGGVVLPPPNIPEASPPPGQLVAWRGTPLEDRNRQAVLETGTLFCLVGDPRRIEAVLVIDQADIELVRVGQRVRLQIDQVPGRVLYGEITELARHDLKVAPRELAAEGRVATRPDDAGTRRPVETLYQARVALDPHAEPLRIGGRGRAKIEVEPHSLAWRLVRFVRQTFGL